MRNRGTRILCLWSVRRRFIRLVEWFPGYRAAGLSILYYISRERRRFMTRRAIVDNGKRPFIWIYIITALQVLNCLVFCDTRGGA